MERQDDAEQHEDASGDDPCGEDYPRGRGYGQDYMRGGEVFGGYGYSDRPEYTRPLAEQRSPPAMAQPASGTGAPPESTREHAGALGDSVDLAHAAGEPERFPQDARAGQWEQPAPTVLEEPDPATATRRDGPPQPTIEGSYGAEGNRNRSRSYYLTQAQLQHRLDGPREAP